jgi:hypothetical protein
LKKDARRAVKVTIIISALGADRNGWTRAERIEQAEAILLKACALQPKSAMIAFNLVCYASVWPHGRGESKTAACHRS